MSGLGLVIPRAGGAGPGVTLETLYASDDFSPPDGLASGRTLNNALGGAASLAFAASIGAAWNITGGMLSRVGAGGTASVIGPAMPQPDYSLYVKVTSISVGLLSLLARRSALSGGTDSRIALSAAGAISGAATGTWEPGDVIGYRVRGTQIEWVKNDLVIATTTALNSAAGYAALAVGANAEYAVDYMLLKIPTP
ncbi:hypothetical protein [Microbacterium allomyrinae]|uniref:Uncharacterized protein n=1 Tax=Microbacterium allomyrinae TaxID=2830666 RepID=A0A9X1LYJ9_9MICO|nr:hypothetical protein [Microbacterium allomyrinae]MCC2034113.1 hypothetical protein [Microbacterium allomyrinae]